MLRRPSNLRLVTPDTPPPPEFILVDVVCLQLVLTNSLPLQFELEKRADHKWEDADKQIVITLGERVIRIPRERILYYETYPTQAKRFKHPPTAEQLAALTKQ